MYLGSVHIVYYYQMGQYLSKVKYCSIPSWPYGGAQHIPLHDGLGQVKLQLDKWILAGFLFVF